MGNFGPTVVKLIEAKGPLHISMRMGSVLSVFDTATGKAFASVLAEDKLNQALAGPIGELLRKQEVKNVGVNWGVQRRNGCAWHVSCCGQSYSRG